MLVPITSLPPQAAPSGPNKTESLLPAKLEKVTAATRPEQAEPEAEERRIQIQEVAAKANAYLSIASSHLQFVVSEQTGRIIVRVIDNETQEVIRQIPPERLDKLAEQFSELRGLLFETQG